MKMRLMTFDEACEACSRKYPTKIISSKEAVFGIGKDVFPWGERVEVNVDNVDIETFYDNSKLSAYNLNGFFVPTWMFKADDTNPNDILRYGIILTDDELWDETDACVRIKIVSYEDNIYYIKIVNGEVVEFKKVGVVG